MIFEARVSTKSRVREGDYVDPSASGAFVGNKTMGLAGSRARKVLSGFIDVGIDFAISAAETLPARKSTYDDPKPLAPM